MKNKAKFGVLLVCTGNTCRSPTAHALLAARVAEAGLAAVVRVDSAGTSGCHAGEHADPRSVATARRHGIDMGGLRARPFRPADWDAFDLVLVAGHDHLAQLRRLMPPAWPGRLALMLDDQEVPDPYYGGDEGFEKVFALLARASHDWLDWIRLHGLQHNKS